MKLYTEKEYRLHYVGSLGSDNICHFDFYNEDAIPTRYSVEFHEDSCKILDITKNVLFEKINIKKGFCFSEMKFSYEVLCEFLKIDYEKFKYSLYTHLPKDELLFYLANYSQDDNVVIPIDNTFTPHSNWSHSDIFKGFLISNKEVIEDDYEGIIRTFVDDLLFTKDIEADNIDDLLFNLSNNISNTLNENELKEFDIKKDSIDFQYKYFKKMFHATQYFKQDFEFEFIPILEDITPDMNEEDIKERESIGKEYRFKFLDNKKLIDKHNRQDDLLTSSIGSAVISSMVGVMAFKSVLNMIRN